MKKCIVISDSFKATLSSLEICEIARESIPKIFPGCEVVTVPVADGGEGTARHTRRLLEAAGKLNASTERGTVEILNSSSDDRYIELSKKLLYR